MTFLEAAACIGGGAAALYITRDLLSKWKKTPATEKPVADEEWRPKLLISKPPGFVRYVLERSEVPESEAEAWPKYFSDRRMALRFQKDECSGFETTLKEEKL